MAAKAAVDLIDGGGGYFRAGSVSNGDTLNYTATSPSSSPVFKVTAAWTDRTSTPGAAYALVSDIDLEIVDPSRGAYRPWILDPEDPSAAVVCGINQAG